MATIPDYKLIAISSPYAMSGVLYEAHGDLFGKNDSNILVWQSETRVMNPSVDADLNPARARTRSRLSKSERLATFRDDLEAAFSLESLRACVIPCRSELPSSSAIASPVLPIHPRRRHDAVSVAIGSVGVLGTVCNTWSTFLSDVFI